MGKTIEIVCGLPASGKTTWAIEERKKDPTNCNILFTDKCNFSNDWFAHILKNYLRKFDRMIIDGLFTDNDDIFLLLNKLKKSIPKTTFVVHYWALNRKQCQINDISRGRIKTCLALIEYMELDNPHEHIGLNRISTIVDHEVFNANLLV